MSSLLVDGEESEVPVRELGLALAVVEQALRDIANAGWRLTYKCRRSGDAERDRRAAEDAREFLLVRLWEDGNLWGELLRCYGVQPMTVARLCHGARSVETTEGRRRNQRWRQYGPMQQKEAI